MGTDDIYFDVKWSHWLKEAIPGTKKRVEFESARIFFPEERPTEFNRELRKHWSDTSGQSLMIRRDPWSMDPAPLAAGPLGIGASDVVGKTPPWFSQDRWLTCWRKISGGYREPKG